MPDNPIYTLNGNTIGDSDGVGNNNNRRKVFDFTAASNVQTIKFTTAQSCGTPEGSCPWSHKLCVKSTDGSSLTKTEDSDGWTI